VHSQLQALVGAYAECEAALQPGVPALRQRVSGSRLSQGIAIDERALQGRRDITAFLRSWSCLVVDELSPRTHPTAEPAAMVAFLLQHLDWLLRHWAAADLLQELADLLLRTSRATGPPYLAQIDLGTCIVPGCSAVLAACNGATPAIGGAPGSATVSCSAGHSWRPGEWLTVMRRLRRNAR
jgi:hypothetical protein